MARIRSIKPDFFKHEGLFDLEQETGLPIRVAFSGLWTVADREGRFEWRPRRIKAEVLPYDDVDFSAVLDALTRTGFVQRYEVDGIEYGAIPSFSEHQRPNAREPQSAIPAPHTQDTCTHVHACAPHERARWEREGEGEGEKKESAPNGADRSFPQNPVGLPSEEFFFQIVLPAVEAKGVRRSQIMRLAKAQADYDETVETLAAAWRSSSIDRYIGGCLRNAKQKAQPPPDEPAFVIEARREGAYVEKLESGNWRVGTYIHDATTGEVIGG